MSSKIGKLEYTTDRIERNSISNSELIYGNNERKNRFRNLVCRIGAPPKQSGEVTLVIVKFVRYNDRRKIYINKKLPKGTNASIFESLTAHRVAKLKEAKLRKNLALEMSGIMMVEWYVKVMVTIKPKYILIDIVALFYREKN